MNNDILENAKISSLKKELVIAKQKKRLDSQNNSGPQPNASTWSVLDDGCLDPTEYVHYASASTQCPVTSSLDQNWSQLLVNLRQQSSLQVQEMKGLMGDKDTTIKQLQSENMALKELIHYPC